MPLTRWSVKYVLIVAKRKSRRKVRSMSSVGFTPQSKDYELEKLREAWRSLNDLLKNLANAEAVCRITI